MRRKVTDATRVSIEYKLIGKDPEADQRNANKLQDLEKLEVIRYGK